MERPDVNPYDALLLVSFGGPERPEDVVPFLENVTRGRGIPRERLEEVGQHYYQFGGRSPINDLNRDLLAAIEVTLAEAEIDIPVYWGNRNWDPYLVDVLAQMAADGITRAACFATSAYSSWSSCRQYRENLFDATAPLGDAAPRLDKLRHYFNHPGFIAPVVDGILEALDRLPDGVADQAELVFVTHSIPVAMNQASGADGEAYLTQHLDAVAEVAGQVAERTGVTRAHDLVFCSRSGPPSVPWLEPDVNDHLTALAERGAAGVVLTPIGFVSDHMEVVYDLDTEALATASALGLPAVRSATPQADPRFAAMIRDLLVERASVERGESVQRVSLGSIGPMWDICPVGCCANPRGPRPALCGLDS
ncbi:ferrochelatase [Nocardioides sp.]|uniref:ferrochelatase n=1 Tax=Nocardioides sp. TaxID=35761 RepID=UPI0035636152